MTTTIDLPNDNTAVFLDGDELSNKDVKVLRRAARRVGLVGQKLKDLGLDELREQQSESQDDPALDQRALQILSNLSDDEDDVLDLFQRTCVVVRLAEWSLDRPLPEDVDEVDSLPRPIYAVLTKEATNIDLNESFGIEGATDPKAPTENSDS